MAARRLEHKLDPSGYHYREPDFDRPSYQPPEDIKQRMFELLEFLYGEPKAKKCFDDLLRIMQVHYAHKSLNMIEGEKRFDPSQRLNERDMILITYPDQMRSESERPLRTLKLITTKYLKGIFNTIHILPFYPYSSDRGFSVVDFLEVDPKLGTWEDIASLKRHFRLMFDLVLNHVSSQSPWFRNYLKGDPEYDDFFIPFKPHTLIPPQTLKEISRPRTTPLLTPYKTIYGTRLLWTTFSPDQIDLNYKNPQVLLKMIEIMLAYVVRGADVIRLDAVTYLWREFGTSCTHLDETHAIVKLLRVVLDAVAPQVALVTETNTPHKDNIRYFGNGGDEAQMVYNFALPPLTLRAFQTKDATHLTNWAMSLDKVSDTATYLNFLDSHDGIGLMGVKEIFSKKEIDDMVAKALSHGGDVSYKSNGDGANDPYELNITWQSAINHKDSGDPAELQTKKYLASRSIALVLMGVPGIYVHGLLGAGNDPLAVLVDRQKRSINRAQLEKERFVNVTEEDFPTAYGYVKLIRKRIREKAFHPNAPQRVIDVGSGLFALVRTSVDGTENILAITNVTDQRQQFTFDLGSANINNEYWWDILTGMFVEAAHGVISLQVEPYRIIWLKSI